MILIFFTVMYARWYVKYTCLVLDDNGAIYCSNPKSASQSPLFPSVILQQKCQHFDKYLTSCPYGAPLYKTRTVFPAFKFLKCTGWLQTSASCFVFSTIWHLDSVFLTNQSLTHMPSPNDCNVSAAQRILVASEMICSILTKEKETERQLQVQVQHSFTRDLSLCCEQNLLSILVLVMMDRSQAMEGFGEPYSCRFYP